MSLPFTGIAAFAKVPPYNPDDPSAPHAAILGIPFDEGTTNLSGARLGPRAIREASTQYAFYKRGRGYHDLESDRPMLQQVELRDGGDVEIVPTALEVNLARIGERVRAVAARGALPVCLGGDHSITFPIVRALAEEAAERRAPHAIPTYAIRVADDFHRFYHHHRVLESGAQAFRLALCRATQAVIARSLDLIGVEAPERM